MSRQPRMMGADRFGDGLGVGEGGAGPGTPRGRRRERCRRRRRRWVDATRRRGVGRGGGSGSSLSSQRRRDPSRVSEEEGAAIDDEGGEERVSGGASRRARVGVGPQDAPPRGTRKAASSSNPRGCASRACPSTWAWSSRTLAGGVPKAALQGESERSRCYLAGWARGGRLLRRPTTNDARSSGLGSSKGASRATVCASTERRSRSRRRDARWQRTLATDDEQESCFITARAPRRRPASPFSRVSLVPARATGREDPRRRAAREAIPSVSSRASSELHPLRRDGGPARTLAGARPLPLDIVASSPRTTPIRASLTLPVFPSPSSPARTQAALRNLADKMYEKRKVAALEVERVARACARADDAAKLDALVERLAVGRGEPQSKPTQGRTHRPRRRLRGPRRGRPRRPLHRGPPILAACTDPDARVPTTRARRCITSRKCPDEVSSPSSQSPSTRSANSAPTPTPTCRTPRTSSTDSSRTSSPRAARSTSERSRPCSANASPSVVRDVRQFLVGWISALDSAPDIDMLACLPDMLDARALHMLSDPNREIRQQADSALGDFLAEIRAGGEEAATRSDLGRIVLRCWWRGRRSADEFTRVTAVTWLREFVSSRAAPPRSAPRGHPRGHPARVAVRRHPRRRAPVPRVTISSAKVRRRREGVRRTPRAPPSPPPARTKSTDDVDYAKDRWPQSRGRCRNPRRPPLPRRRRWICSACFRRWRRRRGTAPGNRRCSRRSRWYARLVDAAPARAIVDPPWARRFGSRRFGFELAFVRNFRRCARFCPASRTNPARWRRTS